MDSRSNSWWDLPQSFIITFEGVRHSSHLWLIIGKPQALIVCLPLWLIYTQAWAPTFWTKKIGSKLKLSNCSSYNFNGEATYRKMTSLPLAWYILMAGAKYFICTCSFLPTFVLLESHAYNNNRIVWSFNAHVHSCKYPFQSCETRGHASAKERALAHMFTPNRTLFSNRCTKQWLWGTNALSKGRAWIIGSWKATQRCDHLRLWPWIKIC